MLDDYVAHVETITTLRYMIRSCILKLQKVDEQQQLIQAQLHLFQVRLKYATRKNNSIFVATLTLKTDILQAVLFAYMEYFGKEVTRYESLMADLYLLTYTP